MRNVVFERIKMATVLCEGCTEEIGRSERAAVVWIMRLHCVAFPQGVCCSICIQKLQVVVPRLLRSTWEFQAIKNMSLILCLYWGSGDQLPLV